MATGDQSPFNTGQISAELFAAARAADIILTETQLASLDDLIPFGPAFV